MIYSPRGNSVLPNGTLINDVCHIYQSTTPATRPDGSALVVGDIWYSTVTRRYGWWNGTYWLGRLQVDQSSVNSLASSNTIQFGTLEYGNHLIVKASYWVNNAMTLDASNYWVSQISFGNTNGGYETTYFSNLTFNSSLTSETIVHTTLNQASTSGAANTFRWFRDKTGSPSNLSMTYMLHTHPIL